jgi:ribosomal protein S18 acetylase RimI-like enzyme
MAMTVEIVEKNTFGHFRYLPELLGFSVGHYDDITFINTGLYSSMFNIVCDTHLEKWANQQEGNFDPYEKVRENISICGEIYLGDLPRRGQEFVEKKINQVINLFKDQPFAWWVGPSCDPPWLSETLSEMYFKKPTIEHAMLCELENFEAKSLGALTVNQVLEKDQVEHFLQVLEPYDKAARPFFEKLENWMLDKQEKLFVGYENNTPVAIASLYLDIDTKSAGVFNLITLEHKRGKGFATQMMHHLLEYAQKAKMKYATLYTASDSGYRIYERLGFKTLGKCMCFEWAG